MYFAFFLILFLCAGVANFGYIEQMGAMVWHGPWVSEMVSKPGGIAELLAMTLTQFFVYPWLGAVITAAVLAVSSYALYRAMKRQPSLTLYILAAFPATALLFLVYNTNYMYTGVTAYLLATLAIWGTRRQWDMPIAAGVVYLIAGPIAWVYLACSALIWLKTWRSFKKTGPFWAGAIVVMILAWLYYRTGVEWKHAMGADAYFTHRLKAPFLVWMPWILAPAVVALSYLMSASGKGLWRRLAVNGLLFVALAGYGIFGVLTYINADNERYKALNLMAANRDWDAIIHEFEGQTTNNLLFQNVLNMAYAERGVLGDSLFSQPVVDIRSIYQQPGERNPYVAMLMSDVYYSMGHLGQAQRYAFEANEMLGNHSPRMLRRLIETNRLTGADRVADKYQAILDKTLYGTRGQAPADPTRMTVADTARLGFPSLDTELWHVAKTHPQLETTPQYLGALYLLSKDLHGLQRTVDSLYQGRQIPKHFQEALLLTDVEHIDSIAEHYNIPKQTVDRFSQFMAQPQSQRDSYWYFYRYTR